LPENRATGTGFAVLSSYMGMISLDAAVNTPPICLTAMADSFGLSEARMGAVAAAVFSGVVLGIFVAGPLGDRFGLKPFLLFGTVLQAVGMLAVGHAPGFFVVLVGTFTAGCGGGVLDALLSPFVCTLRPREKTRAMNLLHAFYCIGAAGTVGVGRLLLSLGWQWQTVFLVGILPSLAAFPGLALAQIPPSRVCSAGYIPLRKLVRNPRFFLLLLAMLLCGGTELGPAQWLPAYAERALGWPRRLAPVILLMFSVAMAVGRLSGARLARRLRPETIIFGAAAVCAVLLLFMSQPWLPLVSVISGVLFGVAVATLWPTTLALTATRFPGGGAAMFSALGAFGNAGGIVAPWIMGVAAEWANMHWALALVTLLPLGLIAILRGSRTGGCPGADGGSVQ